jgi:hypothetical protein
VNLWSSSSDSASNSRLGYWLGLYAALAVIEASALILAVLCVELPFAAPHRALTWLASDSWTWVIIVPAASKNLHSIVLRACMRLV